MSQTIILKKSLNKQPENYKKFIVLSE